MKIFTRILFAVLILVLIALGLVYFVPGYDIYFVRSESMVPNINMGDIVVTGPINGFLSGALETGKVVTYQHEKDRITHRIIAISGDTLTTKGDALKVPDPWPVMVSDVKGIVFFHVPYLGFIAGFSQTKTGWFLAIIIPGAILVLWIVWDIIKEAFKT